MTGYRSPYFRHNCAASGCYYETLPDWGDLIDCFPRGIRPTDVDGMVEINGNFLFLEQKGPGVPLIEAQRRALRTLSELPGITTMFIRPPGPRLHLPSDLECLIFGQGPAEGWQSRSREWLKDWLRTWSTEADRTRRAAS